MTAGGTNGYPGRIRPYVLALVTTAAALALTRLTWPFFARTPYAPVFAAVAITTHWGGGAAGLLVIGLVCATAPFTFPGTGPWAWNPMTLVGFLVVALVGNRLIAGRNRATVALRASEAQLRGTLAHLRETEETVRRAQKMEAVGQLAAGVAHNFNNLLTITMGYVDALDDPRVDDQFRATAVDEIRRATHRGATLARQLLAFGRRHDPRVARVDVDAGVAGLRDMLARVIREDITLTIAAGARRAVLIDPHDLEQVVFNLVINARDALPGGGDIAAETSVQMIAAGDPRRDPSVLPGEYVCVRVRDNGVGMSPEVQAHLFEPFFTTKEVGEGTGLGLAFVHGIAVHAGGFVDVESALGRGTTVSVYLPPVALDESDTSAPIPSPTPPAVTGNATILLVEDEDAVRRVTTQMLSRAGYRVLAASSASEARAIFARHASEIDLLLTDVVMPGMHGPELAELLLVERPDLPVLLMSGYSDTMPGHGTAPGRRAFLAKPFTMSAVSAVIEALVAAPKGRTR